MKHNIFVVVVKLKPKKKGKVKGSTRKYFIKKYRVFGRSGFRGENFSRGNSPQKQNTSIKRLLHVGKNLP